MATPRISCIMPTANRRDFVEQAIKLFQAQDYPNKELVIVDDGEEKIAGSVPVSPEIRYVAISERCTIGMKRNLAISLAHGEIICHWDDDDYYGPERLSKQVAPLLANEADISALAMRDVIDLARWQAWRCTSEALHKEIFTHNVHTGTLMFRTALWRNGIHYPDVSSGEDAAFLRDTLQRGARLQRIENSGEFIYMRHGRTNWPLPPMQYPHMQDWQQVPLEQHLADSDRAFYASFRSYAACYTGSVGAFPA